MDAVRSGLATLLGDLEDSPSVVTVSEDADFLDLGIESLDRVGAGPVRLEDLALAAVGFTAGRFREERGIGIFLGIDWGAFLLLRSS